MGEVIDFRKRVELPPELPAVCETLGLDMPGPPVGFRFKRVKGGVDVWLFFKGGFRLNLTCQHGQGLRNFFEARKWALHYAMERAFVAKEIKRSKKAKPRPALTLVKSGGVRCGLETIL